MQRRGVEAARMAMPFHRRMGGGGWIALLGCRAGSVFQVRCKLITNRYLLPFANRRKQEHEAKLVYIRTHSRLETQLTSNSCKSTDAEHLVPSYGTGTTLT